MSFFPRPALLCLVLTLSLAAASPAAATTALDLRVDADRDGQLTPADDTGEDAASVAAGAIVLANVDDDANRCAADLDRRLKGRVTLLDLTTCNDSADEAVNGPEDAKDLARVQVAPAATTDATLTVTGNARAFLHAPDGTWQPATGRPLDLRDGAELGVETTDIVRDPAVWDGIISLTIHAPGAQPDSVTLRAAPLLAIPATSKATTLLADLPATLADIDRTARETLKSQLRYGRQLLADKRAGKPVPKALRKYLKNSRTWEAHVRRGVESSRAFGKAQRAFLQHIKTNAHAPVEQAAWGRPWVQDAYEPFFQSMPVAGGGAQTMRVGAMAGAPIEKGDLSPRNPAVLLATAIVRNLRGHDNGVVQHLPPAQAPGAPPNPSGWQTTGTMEATPPTPDAPLGRLIVGSRVAQLGQATAALVAGQGGAQPLLQLDTGWLHVGHTDELLAFVGADTARGWVAIVADPELALDTLRKLPGQTKVLNNLRELDGTSAQTTARAILDGPVGRASKYAAGKIEAQLTTLRRELALGDQDIVRVPVLYTWRPGTQYVVAFTGNTVNGVAPGGRRFLAPDPHGPIAKSGRDQYKTLTERALKRAGVATTWINTWPLPHLGSGEVHCLTNAIRDLTQATWWR